MNLTIDYLTEAESIELNHKIVERLRLMRQIRSHKETFKFKIGDRVTFHPSGHELQIGTLTRFNRKSATVITVNGGPWNVAPTLIELAQSKDAEGAEEHALNRDGKNGDFTAVLSTEHTFSKPGIYSIAARVQDNLDGQATVVARIEVSENDCRIIEEKIVSL